MAARIAISGGVAAGRRRLRRNQQRSEKRSDQRNGAYQQWRKAKSSAAVAYRGMVAGSSAASARSLNHAACVVIGPQQRSAARNGAKRWRISESGSISIESGKRQHRAKISAAAAAAHQRGGSIRRISLKASERHREKPSSTSQKRC